VTVGALTFENNTLFNLNFVDNANNAGIFGLQVKPGSFSFKNNLFLNMTGKAVLAGANAKYLPASDLGVSAANNWFFDVPSTYFTDHFTLAQAAGTILNETPCYNAPGGLFNILASSDISGKEVGASKWWTPYVEEPEDLTLVTLTENKTWNLANAKYFSGTIKKEMVRDGLYLHGSEENAIVVANGMLNFQNAAVTNRAGVPADGYIAFKVSGPGSVIIKAADPESQGRHFIVGGFIITLGAVTMLIELFEHITFGHPMFRWSLYSAGSCLAAGFFFLLIGMIRPLREALDRRFFL
jgi:hypothetical protein